MNAPAGWYPDPGGAPGRFRFWDGGRWAAETTDRPDAAHPGAGAGRPPVGGPAGPYARTVGAPPRRVWGWWLGAAALLVAVAVAATLVVRAVVPSLSDPADPGEDPGQQTCPRVTSSASPQQGSTGDRVRSGALSYPRLASPFTAPQVDDRTPFGHDVQSQQAPVETSTDGTVRWVSWALIARLLAGDGFYGPEQGAEVVADCVTELFYDDFEIRREDTRRQATTVDGRPAYLIESHLTFDIPGLRTKGETMIIVVVDVGQQGEAGLFYGTVPDTAPQHLPPVRDALAGLQVG